MPKQFQGWNGNKPITAVVLCAGRGARFFPVCENMPKALMPVLGKPILGYNLDFWKPYVEKYVFVVNYQREQIIDYVKKNDINASFVIQPELKGIANALLCAEKEVGEKFIVVLGDCLIKGKFSPVNDYDQAISIWKTKNTNSIHQSYSVEVDEGFRVRQLIEKPKKIINNLCGMGYYFFNKTVFSYIKNTSASSLRNEVEITDVIQNMISNGEKISAVEFNGEYLNVTREEDIKKAESIFKFDPDKSTDN